MADEHGNHLRKDGCEKTESEIQIDADIASSQLSFDRQIEWQDIRFKNRRRMAWCSIGALIMTVLLLFFAPISDSKLQIIADPVAMIAFVFGGVIGAYMGFTAIEKYKMDKK